MKWAFVMAVAALACPIASGAQALPRSPLLWTFHQPRGASSLAFSPDGKDLLAAYEDDDGGGGMVLWNLISGKATWRSRRMGDYLRRRLTMATSGSGERLSQRRGLLKIVLIK